MDDLLDGVWNAVLYSFAAGAVMAAFIVPVGLVRYFWGKRNRKKETEDKSKGKSPAGR